MGGVDLSTLYVISTPIGNLGDLSPRAAQVLQAVVAVAAEDTRVTARILNQLPRRPRMISHRSPVEHRSVPRVLEALAEGDVALVTDAGTPTLSDPGGLLVAAAWRAGHRVTPIPGPSAITAAVAASGFAGEGFTFVGFLPRRAGELRRLLASLQEQPWPTVAFESPHRLARSLAVVAEVLPERALVVARELTKLHEQILRGTAAAIVELLDARIRGEITLVIAGTPPPSRTTDAPH